ncbi:MAG: glycine oxidase ThiO [Chloroflexota bacterium]
MQFDAIIVGGGVIGLSIARELVRAKLKVCIIEKDKLGAGTSSIAAGGLPPHYDPGTTSAAFLELCSASRDLFPQLVEDLKREVGFAPDYQQNGSLYVVMDAADWPEVEARVAGNQSLNYPVERVAKEDLTEFEPNISPYALGGLFYPGDHHVETDVYVRALVAACQNSGMNIFEGTTVEEVLVKAGHVEGVRTSLGTFYAPTVVNCAGALAGKIPGVESLPVFPTKGQGIRVQSHSGPIASRIIFSSGCYMVPRPNNAMWVGATKEPHVDTPYQTLGPLLDVLNITSAILPIIRDCEIQKMVFGFRPTLPDHMPVIGESSIVGGLYHAFGHYALGILLSPITAKIIGALVTGQIVTFDLAPLRPDRFQSV